MVSLNLAQNLHVQLNLDSVHIFKKKDTIKTLLTATKAVRDGFVKVSRVKSAS